MENDASTSHQLIQGAKFVVRGIANNGSGGTNSEIALFSLQKPVQRLQSLGVQLPIRRNSFALYEALASPSLTQGGIRIYGVDLADCQVH